MLPGGTTAPTLAEVLAGTGPAGITPTYASTLVVTTAGATYSATATELTPETVYDVYIVLSDQAGNQTLTQTTSVTTLATLANSYMTRLQADAYMTTRLYVSQWNLASDNSKERALQMATRELDAMAWLGTRTDSTQLLSWPRSGLVNYDGYSLDSTVIPDFLMYATAELAFSLIKEDRWEESDSKGIEQVTAGPITVKFDKTDRKAKNHPIVMSYIRSQLSTAKTGGANWTLIKRA